MLDEEPPLININIDLKPLAGLGNKLIDAVERATGRPWLRRREAQADAEAKVVLAKADAEAKEIGFRVSERLSYLEARRQRNIEAITAGALREWPADISDEPVKEDWVAQFFNLAQDVGDEQMQGLWARLLAGEVAHPGSYSPMTLSVVRCLHVWSEQIIGRLRASSYGGVNCALLTFLLTQPARLHE